DIGSMEEYRAAGVPMLAVVSGFVETKRQNLVYVAAMVLASLWLVHTGVVGILYLVVATVLGLVYIGLSLEGFFTKDDHRWGERMFFYSLVYLTAMLLAMIVDPLLLSCTFGRQGPGATRVINGMRSESGVGLDEPTETAVAAVFCTHGDGF